jgi:hypothetical protein
MHATDTDGRFPTPTTRRTIIATGAKLAYAAPLVAASVKVSEVNAQVFSGGFCGHSTGINGGCMSACTTARFPFTEAQCGVICGTGQITGACPVGQGGDNPCCNPGYCNPANYLFDTESGNPVYVGGTRGCPPITTTGKRKK